MRCYKCEEGLPHIFHDGGDPTGNLELIMEPYRGRVQQLPRNRWNKDAHIPVVSGERITDDLVRSMDNEPQT